MRRDRQAWSFRSIVHVNEKAGAFGGTEEYIEGLTQALASHGVRSHLVCGLVAGQLPTGLASTHVVAGLADRDCPPGTAEEVASIVTGLRVDVVYLHNLFDPRIVDALDSRGRSYRLVWYVHDHYATCLTELRLRSDSAACDLLLGEDCIRAVATGSCVRRHANLPLGAEQLAERAMLLHSMRRVDGVVVVSPYMQRLLVAHLPDLAERIHLLPRPIRPGLAGSSPRAQSGERLPENAGLPGAPVTRIAFAGRITSEKGLDTVLEALASIATERHVELCIAGPIESADYWDRCAELAQAGANRNDRLTVRFLGHLDADGIDALFARSDIVVVPSRWPEPLGAVVPEALRAGAAVVASRIGGLDTFLRHRETGLLVEPGDPAAWAEALTSLAERPKWAITLARDGAAAVANLTAHTHLRALDQILRPTSEECMLD